MSPPPPAGPGPAAATVFVSPPTKKAALTGEDERLLQIVAALALRQRSGDRNRKNHSNDCARGLHLFSPGRHMFCGSVQQS
jgi:hypothetical protein